MPKFKRPENFAPWTKEKTQQQIEKTQEAMKDYCRLINDLDSKICGLVEQKRIISSQIGKRERYIKQLKRQMADSEIDLPEWSEPDTNPQPTTRIDEQDKTNNNGL